MSLRAIRVNRRKVWQARVAFKGLRKRRIRPPKHEARQAESDLLHELHDKAGQAAETAAAPATILLPLDR
jgi:CO/xanthine dehydrogenase FAD-binding subunit